MGNERRWWELRRKQSTTTTAESVDIELIIQAARHVVTTRVATQASLARHLYLAPVVADQLLAKLEHCEVVGPERPGEGRPVLTTSGELPAVIAEFRRRG